MDIEWTVFSIREIFENNEFLDFLVKDYGMNLSQATNGSRYPTLVEVRIILDSLEGYCAVSFANPGESPYFLVSNDINFIDAKKFSDAEIEFKASIISDALNGNYTWLNLYNSNSIRLVLRIIVGWVERSVTQQICWVPLRYTQPTH